MSRKNNYFTFGVAHLHPVTGKRMSPYWIHIVGNTGRARAWMVKHFNNKWSQHYTDKSWSDNDHKFFPGGCFQHVDLKNPGKLNDLPMIIIEDDLFRFPNIRHEVQYV